MRRDHRRRRARLSQVLTDLTDARAIFMDGGVHAVIEVGGGVDRETRIIEGAAALGVRVLALSRYWAHDRASRRYGIVLGHPAPDSDGEDALVELATIVNRTAMEQSAVGP